MWSKVDKPLQMFRLAGRNTRIFGYAGPADGKATEAFTKYIVTDMYAKAVQGMKAEDARQVGGRRVEEGLRILVGGASTAPSRPPQEQACAGKAGARASTSATRRHK